MTSNRFIYIILSAFIAGNLLLIFLRFNSVKNIDDLITGNEKLLNELKLGNQLRELERDLFSAENKIRSAVALHDTAPFNGFDIQIAQAQASLDSLRKISDNDSTLRNIYRLSEVASEKLHVKNQILDSFYRSGSLSSEDFRSIQNRRKLSNELNNLSRKIYDSRQRLQDSLSVSLSNSGKKARTWGTVMIVVVLVSGAVLFWYIINRLRRQNQLIAELDASQKKLREASMIKENFMANMSHEIRTPMNAIIGFTNMLKTKNRDPALTEFVESIHQSGENLLNIVNDILDLSKIEAGMMPIESRPFSVRGLIHSIQTLFGEKINEKGLLLSTTIDESIPDTLLGDATRLTQILVNMIGNAVKFTAQGSIHLGVNNQGSTGNHIRVGFIIKDSGIGIAEEKLSGIFERFRQAEDYITRKYGGTGLGLSIVRDLVLLQKGEIHVESTLGEGTTFSFVIPYDIVDGQMKVLPPDAVTGFDLPGSYDLNILIVEDNEMNQNLLKHLLNGWKFSFDIANNGVEALEKLEAKRYDIVLMDIQMPLMDGYTATQEIRNKLKMDIPIIAMTAHAFAGEREKCQSYGMNEYVAKPINEKELYRLITKFTGIVSARAGLKRNMEIDYPSGYQFINLQYMREISEGDREYERTVTEQFIEAIPHDLEALAAALANKDLVTLRQTAHNMKTNVSVMGLSEILQPYLDELEYDAFDESRFHQTIVSIRTICTNSMPEARHFFSTL